MTHTVAARIGVAIVVPSLVFLLVGFLEPQPLSFGLRTLLTIDGNQTSPLGYTMMASILLSFPAALLLTIWPAFYPRRGGLRALPRLNLVLAILLTASIVPFLVGFALDQYPCWIGQPNCD